MRQLLTLVLLVSYLSLSGCAEYTPRERTLFSLMVAGQFCDFATTEWGLDHGYVETNPLLKENPTDAQLALFKASSIGLFWFLGEVFPEKREFIFTIGAISGFGATGYNLIIENK